MRLGRYEREGGGGMGGLVCIEAGRGGGSGSIEGKVGRDGEERAYVGGKEGR